MVDVLFYLLNAVNIVCGIVTILIVAVLALFGIVAITLVSFPPRLEQEKPLNLL
ncbi:MAG: hypothetical protein ACJ70P_04355 [Nitrososphaera sp.]